MCETNSSRKPQSPWRSVAPALALAFGTSLFLAALSLRAPAAQEPVALFFNPTVSSDAALHQVAALDGRIVRVGGFRNVVVAVFDRDVTVAQLWRHGAWIGIDPVFVGGCDPAGAASNRGIT
ncbi:hypothetical protein [Pelagibius sp. Alg239-R121]|uniref:hypothetical protein n=1 Tax=Pelagibius sp. Alg239-R121 TaxID=2993448 RepID=UPI0024A7030E|nr:hypothetical protein [Pelagibius sp. Alg239-R121]